MKKNQGETTKVFDIRSLYVIIALSCLVSMIYGILLQRQAQYHKKEYAYDKEVF